MHGSGSGGWSWRETCGARHGAPLPPATVKPRHSLGIVRLTAVLCALVATLAGPLPAAALLGIDEVTLGLMAHDIRFLGNQVEAGADVNVELLFLSPAFLSVLGAPRPQLGGTLNTADTTNYVYGGLTWRGQPWRPLLALPDALFVAGSLGGGLHDGHLNMAPQIASGSAPGSSFGRAWRWAISSPLGSASRSYSTTSPTPDWPPATRGSRISASASGPAFDRLAS